MKRLPWIFLALLLSAFLLPPHLYAQLYSLQTRNLRLVYYSKGHEYLVPHLARCFENAFQFHSKRFDYTPSEEVTLILQDFGDYASGGANTVPFNLIGIGISPFNYSYETMPPSERMSLMMNHELVHVVTMDKPSSTDRVFRSLFFGKVHPTAEAPPSMLFSYMTSPRWNSPRWFIEGIAVFLETWMGGGLGRALGAYDEMVFRTMVRDSAYFYDVVGLESEGTKVDFQVGANSYLYGTRFVSYLALMHGPDKLISWYNQTSDSKSYFASQFENVYGTPLEEEWSRWIRWEHQWQHANLDSIRVNPVTRERPLSQEALGSVSRAVFDSSTGKIYAAVNYPGQTSHIAAIDLATGKIQRLHDVRGGALFYVSSLAYDPATRTLFYSTDNNQWRDLNALDVITGESRLLIKDARTGDFAFNRSDRSIWGVRHFNGISTIVRIPYPYTEWNQIYSWDYGKDLFDLDLSPDGTSLTGALGDVTGRQILIKMETKKLIEGDATFETLYDFENSSPASFAFTLDGKHLFGTTYYSGVSNVVRYDVDQKSLHWVSNAESGLFRPVPLSSDSLIAFHYTGTGFLPVMIPNQTLENISAIRYLGQAVVEGHPELKSWNLKPPSPSTINIDSLTISHADYSPMGNIKLGSAYPIVEGYKASTAVGMRFNFSDPILLHGIDLSASYTPTPNLPQAERLHLLFNYRFWQWKVKATWNIADFYDLFGPTKYSRKGYSLSLQRQEYIIFDEPETLEYRVVLAGYGDLERLPDYQNIASTFDRLYSVDGRLLYKNLAKSLGAVDDEKGVEGELILHTNYANSKVYPLLECDLSYGFLLPLDHSSLWLRGSLGHGFGNQEDPFANFFFGGFGNNWVDHQQVRRYREAECFPGAVLNSIGGNTYARLMTEWDLPPIRFRRLGFPTFYCNWARIALFSSALVANPDRETVRRSLLNAGVQIDFRFVIFSSLDTTFSLGYALATERARRLTREFMFSLKIL